VLERGPDGGLLDGPVSLSPSQAESYLTCPRRYAFERRLHVDRGGSVHMELGSLIHSALEAAERVALERGAAHADLDEAMAALAGEWDPARFGGPPWSDGWRRRAERIVTHLYEAWPGTGKVAALEHRVEMDLDGLLWRGYIDRVEVEEGADGPVIRIIDYKTSTSVPSKPEAAVSVQLGFYVIAAEHDPVLSALGPVAGAELWYPAVRQKSVARRALDPARLPDVAGLLAAAAAGITSEDWEPHPGPQCDRCPVRSVCPAWPEGREAYAS
jgi:RecB family exonuclease